MQNITTVSSPASLKDAQCVEGGSTIAPAVSPLSKLTPEQNRLILEFRELTKNWNTGEEEDGFLDDLCLFRYLHGYLWNLDEASKFLKETVEWRSTFKPHMIKAKDFEDVGKTGYMFHHGFDRKGRPVVYQMVKKDVCAYGGKYSIQRFKQVCYVTEQCVRLMPANVYQVTWVLDLEGMSLSLGMIKEMKDLFLKLSDYYCERLSLNIVVNYSWSCSMVWNFAKMFLYQETIDKYQFINGYTKDDIKSAFLKYIDEDQLLMQYGGNSTFEFDFADLVGDDEKRGLY